eukprot:6172109-Pleurochrysis_carterae.AAC.2
MQNLRFLSIPKPLPSAGTRQPIMKVKYCLRMALARTIAYAWHSRDLLPQCLLQMYLVAQYCPLGRSNKI